MDDQLDFGAAIHTALLANIASLSGSDSFELAPGHVLRSASEKEIDSIKGLLPNFTAVGPMSPWMNPWEVTLEPDPEQKGQRRGVPLPRERWRYFVIHCQGLNHTLVQIEKAAKLSRKELRFAFTVDDYGGRLGFSVHGPRLFKHLNEVTWGRNNQFEEIGAKDAAEISTILRQLQTHDHQKTNVDQLVSRLLQLDGISSGSDMTFLGYFGVLESLLTHKPNPDDPYQSITRQVQKKIALLNRRFDQPLDYGPFRGSSPETIWKKMYDYRSILAHGDHATFDRDLSILGGDDQAMSLLEDTVKAVIRQVLIEPELLTDLRDC
jgi:hypothetical protein